LTLPPGIDPDNFIKKSGLNEFKNLIQKSTPGLKFLIDSLLQEWRKDIPEEKTKIVRNAVDEIGKMPDPIIRSEYLKQASEYLSVDEEDLRRIIQRKSSEEKSEEEQILLGDKNIASYVFPEMKEEYFQGLKTAPVFAALAECFKNSKEPSFHKIREKIDPSLESSLSKTLMLEKEQAATVEEAFECLNALRQFSLENRKKELKAEIISLEKKGDKEKLRSLLIQRQDIINQLSSLSKRNYQNLSYNNRDISAKERN
jgi:DNA primase